jgi:hypothetical protein|tara:strand:+ start:1574 stop:1771 length:198 start_codon:yes stop_codon:yes gene_type:complete
MPNKVDYNISLEEENPLPCLKCNSNQYELDEDMINYKCLMCGEDLNLPVVSRRRKKKVRLNRDWK